MWKHFRDLGQSCVVIIPFEAVILASITEDACEGADRRPRATSGLCGDPAVRDFLTLD